MLDRLARARFEFLGAVPALLVPDNLRCGVTRSHRYEPLLNCTYQEMAAHYGTAILPARANKPRDKAKVEEVGVQIAERRILASLRNERFTSLAEANAAIAARVAWLNNRPFAKLIGTRRVLFEQLDRPAMRFAPGDPLPVRHLEDPQGQHRLPRRRGPPLLQRPVPAGRSAGRRADQRAHRGGVLLRPLVATDAARSAAATAPRTRTCLNATAPTWPGTPNG